MGEDVDEEQPVRRRASRACAPAGRASWPCARTSRRRRYDRGAPSLARSRSCRRLRRSTLPKPRRRASPVMCSRCEFEFDTAVMRALGVMLGHPQRQRAPAAAELEDASGRRRARHARRSVPARGLPPRASVVVALNRTSSRSICGAALGKARRSGPGFRSAGCWLLRRARRSGRRSFQPRRRARPASSGRASLRRVRPTSAPMPAPRHSVRQRPSLHRLDHARNHAHANCARAYLSCCGLANKSRTKESSGLVLSLAPWSGRTRG